MVDLLVQFLEPSHARGKRLGRLHALFGERLAAMLVFVIRIVMSDRGMFIGGVPHRGMLVVCPSCSSWAAVVGSVGLLGTADIHWQRERRCGCDRQ